MFGAYGSRTTVLPPRSSVTPVFWAARVEPAQKATNSHVRFLRECTKDFICISPFGSNVLLALY
jgi:hypothetical protein